MPTSDVAQRAEADARERTRRVTLTVLFLVALVSWVVIANSVLTLVLVPYGSKSEIAWTDYASQDELDCVIVGTSTAMSGIDPTVVDRRLGAHSFNLATPSQLLDESYLAVRTAYEDHGITRVILSLSHSQVMRSSTPNPGSAFMHQRSRVVSLGQELEGLRYLLLDGGAIAQPSSLNMAFPWVSNKVSESLGAIVTNARMKLDGTSLYEAAETNERGWHYQGKGFGYYTSTLNFSGSKAQSYFTQDNPEDRGVEVGRSAAMDADRARALADLCDYCVAHDIELIAVAPPLPDFTLVEYGEAYFTLSQALEDFMAEHGCRYFDINRARPELYASQESYFHDSTHLTLDGAEAFSEAVCSLFERLEAGEETGGLFYEGLDRLDAIDYISCVFVDREAAADGIHLQARAMAGPSVPVEYRLCVHEGDDWHVVEDWTPEDAFVYLPERGRRGAVELRVEARKAGGTEAERHRDLTAMY